MIGMSCFTFGSELAMSKVGHYLGSSITKRKSIVLMVVLIFLLGLMITIAEPDLTILASYLDPKDLNPWILKISVGAGIGVFLVLGFIRIIFRKSLRVWLIFFYACIFGIACLFGGKDGAILEISFDSGGATTGPITVPFLIAFGSGIAMASSGKNESSDTFGITGLCSVGPIIIVMLLGLFIKPNIVSGTAVTTNEIDHIYNLLLSSTKEVLIAILPIMIFFYIYQFFFIKLHKSALFKIFIGFIFMIFGLVIFLSAANFGFIPLGSSLGKNITQLGNYYFPLLLIISIIIGFVIVLAEPGVQVLTHQVEDLSNGSIKRSKMFIALCIGVALAVFSATVKVIYLPDLNILFYFVPLYLLCLLLSLIVPDIYVAVAFDSGGVASGAMSSCFVLPFILGISATLNNGSSGFGVIGLIATMPIIAIQFMGAYLKISSAIKYRFARRRVKEENDDQIIHFKEEKNGSKK